MTVAVRQMDEMTQHNAALVEEINAAIEQTETQATELDRIVAVFTLDGRDEAVAPQRRDGAVSRQKVQAAARTYLSSGNAAIKSDEWAEF